MFALIFKNQVVQLEEKPFPVAPELSWVDVKDIDPQPQTGWSYDGKNFTLPDSLPGPTAHQKITELKRSVIEPLLKFVAGETGAKQELLDIWNQIKALKEQQ